MEGSARHHPPAPGVVAGEERPLDRGGRAVVERSVRHLHAGHLGDQALELEDRGERALSHLRLVGRVGGRELGARGQRFEGGRDPVVVESAAQEGDGAVGVVLARPAAEAAAQLDLGQRPVHRERALEPHLARDRREQVLEARDADALEHPLLLGG